MLHILSESPSSGIEEWDKPLYQIQLKLRHARREWFQNWLSKLKEPHE